MTPEEIRRADNAKLSAQRLALLARPCPSCDLGKEHRPCECFDDLAEVDQIEAELRERGELW